MRVASEAAKQLKTQDLRKLENIRKVFSTARRPPTGIHQPRPTTPPPASGQSPHTPIRPPQPPPAPTAPAHNPYHHSRARIRIHPTIGNSSSGSSNSSSSNSLGISNTNNCMPILVTQGKQTQACMHTGCRADFVQNQMNMFVASIRNRRWLENCKNQIMLAKRRGTSFAV